MKKTLILFWIIYVSTSLVAIAATDYPVKGKVVDEKGEPLAGVSVQVKEFPAIGVVTDAEGMFSIVVPGDGKTLLFKFIGMKSVEEEVKPGIAFFTIRMEMGVSELDPVVVTGYIQTTYKKMTGSVGVITADELKNQAQPTVDALMQGKIAGVVVSAVSGQPGTTQKIRIRGTNTLTGDAEPLWVVDGVPLQGGTADVPSGKEIKTGQFDNLFMTGVAGINPNDIENITILKDAAAAAIYGSRAAAGVIVVTTKKGKQGKMRVNYSGNVSVTFSPQRDAGLMSAGEKLAYEQGLWDEFSAPGFAEGRGNYPVIGMIGMLRSGKGAFEGWTAEQQNQYIGQLKQVNTDWYDELFRESVSTTHNLSLSGGSDKVTYYTSLAYSHNAGLLKKNDYDRYNLTTNLVMQPNTRVKVDVGLALAYQNSKSPALYSVDPFKYAYFANPYEQPYNEDGSYRADATYFALEQYNSKKNLYKLVPSCGFNIMREMDETSSRTKNVDATVHAGLDFSIISKLRFVGLISYAYKTNRVKEIYGKDTKAAFDNRLSVDSRSNKEYSSILQRNADNESYVARGHFVYNDQFGTDHTLSVLAGAELRGSNSSSLYSKRYGYDPVTGNYTTPLPEDPTGVGYEKLKEYLAALDASSGQTDDEQRYASFYASADYYLMNKYIFNVSFRTDGSSNFGSDKQFNPTWAAGAAWNISEENFMTRLKPVINRLTLRLSTGFTGNINRSVSPKMVISYYDDYRNLGDNVYRIGKVVSPPNPNLRWEKTQDMKIALDFGLLDDHLGGIVEGYYRKSSDVVTSVRVLSTTGFAYQKYNTADIDNKGIEATLNAVPVRLRDFTLSLSANVAWNGNKVVKYKSPNNSMALGELWEGYPVGAIYSGQLTGIDPETGLYTFRLRPDAEIRTATDLNKPDNYRYYLGTDEAPVTGGFNVTAKWKDLRLSINGVYSAGAKTFEYIQPPASYNNAEGDVTESTQTFLNDLYAQHLNVRKEAADRWTEENTDGTYPRIWNPIGDNYGFSYYNPTSPEITRGAFLKKLSYMRIKSIVLGYSLPEKLLTKSGLSEVDFSLSLNNFFTVTSYDGMDPETPGATYPISRSVMFSVNIGF